jgi:pimeloyl-ACP methyl ester carboxylesterase
MRSLITNGRRLLYLTDGDGFPLVLVPDEHGTISDWAPSIPLLGELCRVIVYEYDPPHSALPSPRTGEGPGGSDRRRVEELLVLLDTLKVERAYVAGYAGGGQTALHLALHTPERLEGLILIGLDNAACIQPQPTQTGPLGPLQCLTVPTLLVVGEEAPSQLAWTTRLASQLPRCARTVIPQAGSILHREQPLQLGHAMLAFLTQCERQRTLVRGASFLL